MAKDFLLHVGATLKCPHGGQVLAIASNTRVRVEGQPVVTKTDTFTVTGCMYAMPNGILNPCVVVNWLVPATRVLVSGKPVLLSNSTGVCQSSDQTPQGPPNVVHSQVRVKGL
jgi:hypothetical protein